MHFLKLASQQSIGPKVILVSSQRTGRWIYFNTHHRFGQTMTVGLQYKIFYRNPPSRLPSFKLHCLASSTVCLNESTLSKYSWSWKEICAYLLSQKREQIPHRQLSWFRILESPLQNNHLKYSSWRSLKKTDQNKIMFIIKLNWIALTLFLIYIFH